MSLSRSLSFPHYSLPFIFPVSPVRPRHSTAPPLPLADSSCFSGLPLAAMSASFSADEKYELMTRNLQEVLGGDKIKAILAKGETVKCYWGNSALSDVTPKLRERADELTFARLLRSLFLASQEPLLPADVSPLRARSKVWNVELTLSFGPVSSSHRLLCTLHQDRRLPPSRSQRELDVPFLQPSSRLIGSQASCLTTSATASRSTGQDSPRRFVPALTSVRHNRGKNDELTSPSSVPAPDIHAFLDSQKAPLDLVGHRVTYYRHLLLSVFKSMGVPTDKLDFVVGS